VYFGQMLFDRTVVHTTIIAAFAVVWFYAGVNT
jgi:hypothetical protein